MQHSLWAAEALRKRLQARARETLHVLYGLCASEGELTRRLLEFGGSAAPNVFETIEANLPREGHAGAGEETNGYRVCVETAKLNAGKRNSAAVEEIDLLWAVNTAIRPTARIEMATITSRMVKPPFAVIRLGFRKILMASFCLKPQVPTLYARPQHLPAEMNCLSRRGKDGFRYLVLITCRVCIMGILLAGPSHNSDLYRSYLISVFRFCNIATAVI